MYNYFTEPGPKCPRRPHYTLLAYWITLELRKNYEGKLLESNCSDANKNVINRSDSSCNTLQKLRVNNSLKIIVGKLNINSIRNKFDTFCSIFKQKIDILLIFEIKIEDTFPLAQFCVESYSTPYRLDRTLLYVRDVYNQNNLN